MSDTVVQVRNLSKKYRLGVLGTGTLRHDLIRWWHRVRGKDDPYEKVVPGLAASANTQESGDNNPQTPPGPDARSHPPLANDEMWALRDVSFDVKRGEILGVVGRNGAGKSTLLKVLSRVTAPTDGEVRVKGRIASLLEVGTGFHPELTGRENIFLNGAILGMTKNEIKRKLDEIVAFAEVDRYLDTPVKRYSSGMYVRLAFAVAAHLEPEILIVDEVLAVGDAEFQKKCLGKMKDVAGHGRTILFVSHNMEAVRNLCTRGIWLADGQLHQEGPAEKIVGSYFGTTGSQRYSVRSNPTRGFAIDAVRLKNRHGVECSEFQPGDELIVEIAFQAQLRLERPFLTLGVMGALGSCFTANMLLDGLRPEVLEGAGVIVCRFMSIPLLPQTYELKLGVREKNGVDSIVDYQEVAGFRVTGDLARYGFKGDFLERASRYTSVVVPYEWRLPDGTVSAISLAAPVS